MKYLAMTLIVFAMVSCGSNDDEVDPTAPVSEKTEEKLEKVQEDNIDIEKLDGQLDSLLNEIE